MINNSNFYRWDRLAAKSLDQQFVNEIIHGLNCSPFEAEAVLDTVYRVFGDYFDASQRLKPGQIVWNAVCTKTRADSPKVRFVPVTLTMIAAHDVQQLADGVPMTQIMKQAIARITKEAYAQGAWLSMRDIGLLTWRSGSAIS